jgi:hypothetical protein
MMIFFCNYASKENFWVICISFSGVFVDNIDIHVWNILLLKTLKRSDIGVGHIARISLIEQQNINPG